MIVKNDLFDYENRYIFQDTDFFKFSLDSILLPEFVQKYNTNGKILDICTGNGAACLILSKYTSSPIAGFEIQSKVYNLANRSIKINNLENQITIINDDIKNIGNYFQKESFSIMMCNPPYFEYNGKMVNNVPEKMIARHEVMIKLEDIFIIAKDYLENKGVLYIINRTERLDELFILGNKYNLNVKEIQLVKTKRDANPSIVIAKCIKNSKNHVKINDIICVEKLKTYKNLFKEKGPKQNLCL